MNVVLCDDEEIYLNAIERCVKLWAETYNRQDKVIVKKFRSSEDLLELWSNGMNIDLLFLDIQIPNEMNGMDVARQIRSKDEYIPIAFTTNYAEYAYEGYCVNAIRYLKKPINQNDINACMEIAWRRWINSQEQFVFLCTASQSIRVPVNAIIYAETIGHTQKIYTSDNIGLYEIRATLEQLESKLPEDSFVRCHKSFFVNLRYVRKYKARIITVVSGTEIPVGRKYMQIFAAKYHQYYQGGL